MSFFIHRYWTGPAPRPATSVLAGRIAEGLVGGAPNCLFMDWTDDDLPDEIREIVDAHEGDVPAGKRFKQRANVARLALLRSFGGTWIDHDVLLLASPDRSQPWVAEASNALCSAVMHFSVGDPHLDAALAAVGPADTCRESSGEAMLERVWTDVHRRPLPYSYQGIRHPVAPLWAIHMWGSL
jgi:hypothetical protein